MSRPLKGQMFKDYNKRILTVDNVDIGNSLGREVQGKVNGKDYSCPIDIWETTWRG